MKEANISVTNSSEIVEQTLFNRIRSVSKNPTGRIAALGLALVLKFGSGTPSAHAEETNPESGFDGEFYIEATCTSDGDVAYYGDYINNEPNSVYVNLTSDNLPNQHYDGRDPETPVFANSSSQIELYAGQGTTPNVEIDINVRSGTAGSEYVQVGTAYIEARECSQNTGGGSGDAERVFINGSSPESTSVALARYAFNPSETDEIVIATTRDFADGLTASTVAQTIDAPIVYNGPDSLHPEVEAYINETSITGAIIMGGEAAISEAIEAHLSELGVEVSRIAGPTRVETALRAAEFVLQTTGEQVDEVRLVNGYNFPDASSVANTIEISPILLTNATELPSTTRQFLESHQSTINKVTIGGGTAVVSEAVSSEASQAATAVHTQRLAGETRLRTNQKTIMNLIDQVRFHNSDPNMQPVKNLVVVTGSSFENAGAASALVAEDTAIIFVPNSIDSPEVGEVVDFISDNLSGLDKGIFIRTMTNGQFENDYSDDVANQVAIAINAAANREN